MPKKPAQIKINLLPKDPFFQTFLGKSLKWSLSIGRYIVIFTELIVILSFLTRFSLDRQVTNLNSAINQKQAIIESFGDLDFKVRLAQAKTDHYLEIEQQDNITELFPKLSSITPPEVILSELNFEPGRMSLTAATDDQNSFRNFIQNIRLSQDFTNVRVETIESDDATQSDEEATQSATTAKETIFRFRITADST